MNQRPRLKSFGLTLCELREARGISRESLAYEIGVGLDTVENVELNRIEMPVSLWTIWADAIRVPPSQLVALYLNNKARKICLDAHLPYIFHLTVTEESAQYDQLNQQARLARGTDSWLGS
jgi:transcriptional regulator with XRE-family HTH domain